jgi:hypothetical protein
VETIFFLKTFNMRHLTTFTSLLFTLFLFSAQTTSAQIEIRIGAPRPPRPVVVVERPPCPGRDYVWVEGHYVYDRYTRQNIWIAGQWEYIEPRYVSRSHGHKHKHDRRKERSCDRD